MSFYHVPLPWSVRIPRTYKYSALCTIYLKLVLVSLLAIYSRLSEPSSAKYSATSTRLVSRLSVRQFRSHIFFSSRSPIGRKSVSSWVSPVQEAGRKEYVCVDLASLTLTDAGEWSVARLCPLASHTSHVTLSPLTSRTSNFSPESLPRLGL